MRKEEMTVEIPRDSTRQFPRVVAMRQTRRVAVAILGGLLIGVAVLIIPIPGPWSIPLGILGLTVLSWEFAWAKRLRLRLQDKMKRIKARARARRQAEHR